MSNPTLGGWLVHVMSKADSALSLEEALHIIMDSTKTYFPCQSVAVLLIDEDTKHLRIKISRQISYTFAKQFRKTGPGPTAERIVLEQSTLLLNNLEPDSAIYKEIKLEHDFSSAILAPIITNQRGVGYIFCDRSNGEQFEDSDLLHMQVMGYLIGNLIAKFDLLKTSRALSTIDEYSRALHYKAFVPALAVELQRASSHDYPVALSLLAVDAFRAQMDTFGIEQAHAVLAAVVVEIKKHLRDMDTVARFAADEFIICLSGMTDEESAAIIAKIKAGVAANVKEKDGAPIALTVASINLKDREDLKKPLRDILAELGRRLADAKGHDRIESDDLP